MGIKIQTIMKEDGLKFKNYYWMKDGDQPARKISKAEWFRLYDLPDTKVLAPLTKEKE